MPSADLIDVIFVDCILFCWVSASALFILLILSILLVALNVFRDTEQTESCRRGEESVSAYSEVSLIRISPTFLTVHCLYYST